MPRGGPQAPPPADQLGGDSTRGRGQDRESEAAEQKPESVGHAAGGAAEAAAIGHRGRPRVAERNQARSVVPGRRQRPRWPARPERSQRSVGRVRSQAPFRERAQDGEIEVEIGGGGGLGPLGGAAAAHHRQRDGEREQAGAGAGGGGAGAAAAASGLGGSPPSRIDSSNAAPGSKARAQRASP